MSLMNFCKFLQMESRNGCFGVFHTVSFSRPHRLSQFQASGIDPGETFNLDQPPVLLHGVTIRHPGQIIAYGAMQSLCADAFTRKLADFARVGEIELEQLGQNPPSPTVRLGYLLTEIEILAKILPHFLVYLPAGPTELHQRLRVAANIIGALHTRPRDQFLGGLHHIPHLVVNHDADDEVPAAFVRQVAVFAFHPSGGVMPHGHMEI